jgi:peptidoglycan hydrolase-like protein with peptidoglycan-binding domain
MGPKTESALMDFQRANGIPETGRADDTTRRLLWRWLPDGSP